MTVTASPLAALAAAEPELAVRTGLPREPGWHAVPDLLSPGGLDRAVEDGADALGRDHPSATRAVRRRVAAVVLLSHWSWALGVVGAGSLVLQRRVPDLAPERVALRLVDGTVAGIALLAQTWTESGDLEGELLRTIAGHLAPVHTRLRADGLLRRGERAVWGAAGDGIASALWRLGRQAGEPVRHLADVERLLAGAPAAWGAPGFMTVVDEAGHSHVTRRRNACCLYHRLPGSPVCLTCPRVSDEERARRLSR